MTMPVTVTDRLARWVSPTGYGGADARRAFNLNVILLVTAVVVALGIVAMVLQISRQPLGYMVINTAMIAAAGAIIGLCYWLSHRGRVRLGSAIYVAMMTFATLGAVATGGTMNALPVILIIPVAAAGTTLGPNAGLVTAGISLAAMVGLGLLEIQGVLEIDYPGHATLVLINVFDVGFALFYVTLNVWLAGYQLRRALNRQEALNQELISLNRELDQRVQERTQQLAVAKDAAEAANRAKSTFLANMSHELRTPLNSILGFTDVILRGIDGPITELQRQDLVRVQRNSQHLLALINDILDLSKIEAGKMELAFELVDLREVVEGVMSTAIGLTKEKPILLCQDLPADLPPVVADERRVRQVLLNLVGNAAKFTQQGFIEARAEVGSEDITLAVTDSGIGIPREKLEEVFRVFTRVEDESRKSYEGTGLGLAVSRRLARLHGGELWAESELGVGSTFYLRLPILGPPRETDVEIVAAETAMRPGDGELQILCVDDDPDSLELYRRYLRAAGYVPLGLQDSTRAVKEAERLQPFAIVLDVVMPEPDGWEVLRHLKDRPATAGIPVVMATILSQSGLGLSLGAADYLMKPINEDDLVAALARLSHSCPQGERVLVVDDRPDHRALFRRVIEGIGCEVVEAANGVEALEMVRQHAPQLIVLDLMMPQMDGFTVLEKLKADPATRAIPVIVVTAKELAAEDRRRLNSHVEALIHKAGMGRDVLLQDVVAALDRFRKGVG